MTEPPATTGDFPEAQATVFLVGIGGIGMSGLAQYLAARGFTVAGSDRHLDGPGREDLLDKLRHMGIAVYPQDGSGPRHTRPAAIIASAAVEATNPDFQATADIPRFSRATALAALLDRDRAPQIAIAGSAGKTTVTGWLAATLRALGKRVLVINGGTMIDAETDVLPGNFSEDSAPDFLVVEVDESDRSLVAFTPDVGVVLNVGTDHYSETELHDVFARFLDRCTRSRVIPLSLVAALHDHGPAEQRLFSPVPVAGPEGFDVTFPEIFEAHRNGCSFTLNRLGRVRCGQYGHHSAANAAAVAAAVLATGIDVDPGTLAQALTGFRGIRQRFERMGTTRLGQPVYQDYAHNVQKIAAAIDTARDAVGGGALMIVFQPHGFGPLGFMRSPLETTLQTTLAADDEFILLPVYYAGGTTSFSPTSEAVASGYKAAGLPVKAVDGWRSLRTLVDAATTARAILILGARDPSLPSSTKTLCTP